MSEKTITRNCSCPIASCKRHGDCKACLANHKGKGFCKRSSRQQKMIRFFFRPKASKTPPDGM